MPVEWVGRMRIDGGHHRTIRPETERDRLWR